MRDSNISKLNVTRGEDLTELYVQNNFLRELDLTNNRNLKILDCTGNPLKYINALAPGSDGKMPLQVAAGAGGTVGMKIELGVQRYYADPEEDFIFDGWYDELGDRLSKEQVWDDTYGAGRSIVAWFLAK